MQRTEPTLLGQWIKRLSLIFGPPPQPLFFPPPFSIACSLFRLYSGSNRLSNALFGLTDMNNRSRATFTLINFQVSPVLCRRINHNGVAALTAATHGTTTRDRRPISCTSQTIAARTPQHMMRIWYPPIPPTYRTHEHQNETSLAINFRCENTRYADHNPKNTELWQLTPATMLTGNASIHAKSVMKKKKKNTTTKFVLMETVQGT